MSCSPAPLSRSSWPTSGCGTSARPCAALTARDPELAAIADHPAAAIPWNQSSTPESTVPEFLTGSLMAGPVGGGLSAG
jgi:hypothetical protein